MGGQTSGLHVLLLNSSCLEKISSYISVSRGDLWVWSDIFPDRLYRSVYSSHLGQVIWSSSGRHRLDHFMQYCLYVVK